MANDYNERCRWAVDVLEPKAGDNILEVGCGRGFTAHLISSISNRITITALDRSAKMIAQCRKRQTAENLQFIHIELNKFDLISKSFNKLFVFNMNVFWMDPREELKKIKELLAPGGKFYLFHQPPPGHNAKEFAAAFTNNLTKHGFIINREIYKNISDVDAVCLISSL